MKKFTIEDVKDHSLIVDINKVCFNNWNPKVKRTPEFEKVKDSVRMNGLSMPIVVREIDDRDFDYEVLDGEQRLTAALDLGFTEIWVVNMGKISDEDAKAKTIWLEQAVPFDKDKLGSLLIELKDKIELPYTDEEIELMGGIEIDDGLGDDDFEDDFEDNKLETFKLKLAKPHYDKLKEAIKDLQDTYTISEGTAIMIILDGYENGKSEDIQKLIEKIQDEELDYYS